MDGVEDNIEADGGAGEALNRRRRRRLEGDGGEARY
jgi:hypothetical protein